MWASTVCYEDSYILLSIYVTFVPHRKHVWTATTCYRYSFTFLYVDNVRSCLEN
jgi:hypothetical protein